MNPPETPTEWRGKARQALGRHDQKVLDALDGHAWWRGRTPEGRSILGVVMDQATIRPELAVPYLARQGLGPTVLDRNGQSAVAYVFRGHRAVRRAWLEAFLAHGMPVDWAGADGVTALGMAVRGRHPELVSWLIERGATPSDADRAVALQSNCHASLQVFWDAFGLGLDGDAREALFLDACTRGHMERAQMLLDLGVAGTEVDADGNNALALLSRHGKTPPALIGVLVRRGVDPRAPGVDAEGRPTSLAQRTRERTTEGHSGAATRRRWQKVDAVVAEALEERLTAVLAADPGVPVARRARL